MLPTELICAILSSVSSADDLLSLILTTTQVYESFRAAKETILSAVAHNSLGSHIFTDALITLRCSKVRRTGEVGRICESSVLVRSIYYIIVEANDNFHPPPQLPLTELVPFFQYQRVIESFVQDYASRHIVKYGGPLLTSIELYRLRRAFYRYDTFQTTSRFASEMHKSGCDNLVWPTLLDNYAASPWEVEEVLCVHQYIIERLEDVFDQVEEDFIESVVTLTQDAASLGGDPDATRWYSKEIAKSSRDHPSHFFDTDGEDGEDDPTFFWTSEKRYHYLTAEHLSTFGLPCLRRLLNSSDKRSRRKTIVENFFGHPHTLAGCLRDSVTPFTQENQDLEDGKVLSFEGDAPDKRNLGWLWANQYLPAPSYALPRHYDFRSWGYVFWDRARMEYLNVVRKPCPSVSRNWTPQKRDRGEEKSVEQRLTEMGFIEERTDSASY